jgi:hypothetical protein
LRKEEAEHGLPDDRQHKVVEPGKAGSLIGGLEQLRLSRRMGPAFVCS